MTTLLQVRQVTRRFGGITAVSDVSFDMFQGEVLGLMGANGAGKTTLFSMIAGNVAPSSGQILFEGKAVPARPDQASRLGIARTFQIVRPFPGMTVLENCMVGALYGSGRERDLNQARRICEGILEEVGLSAQMFKAAATLTLAGRKRLEIARALSTHPRLLLLDEVLAGLNASEVDEALALIEEIRQRHSLSIIIIEHVMKVLMRMSHRIVVLHEGKKLMEGTPSQVGSDPRVIKAYLGEKNVRAA
ncbi:ABC transporter ATP-binding protein [Pusillimonas sp. CC-YST705]|uniref:ABC transporter ATP-binding protein n=1 Tax=Mesopusillimonas faecipullorum TaxID=2755040 RepID=A0ABS8CAA1_9BURK|nr:ABC transporter ATP-binding protein [Mesopusillimonas faecipullorum]MCB5362971.1 ABC transporter ATP-binding protein [Mesopusillimonas faecipullorum]